jgi:SAM-dependent methyltransferase
MPSWEELFQQRQWGQWPDSALIRFYKGQFQPESQGESAPEVLEIGAGSGANLWFLAREAAKVSAVDISATAVALAIDKLNAEVPDWCEGDIPSRRVVACSATALPFENSRFDAVVDVECLAHLDWTSAKQAIEECYRVARPGASLFSRMLDDRNALHSAPHGSAGLVVVQTGLLDGMPPLRLIAETDVAELLAPWTIRSIDREVRTINNGAQRLAELVVVATKSP